MFEIALFVQNSVQCKEKTWITDTQFKGIVGLVWYVWFVKFDLIDMKEFVVVGGHTKFENNCNVEEIQFAPHVLTNLI